MILPDVNILVYARRQDSPHHEPCRRLLEDAMNSDEPFAVSEYILSSFVRIVRHQRVFSPPTTLDDAFAFLNVLRSAPNCLTIAPGVRHWGIFQRLCREAGTRGNLVADAYLAALAIESGCEWITTDRDFSRFPGLRWRTPLAQDP